LKYIVIGMLAVLVGTTFADTENYYTREGYARESLRELAHRAQGWKVGPPGPGQTADWGAPKPAR
jgi:hypothetical protein